MTIYQTSALDLNGRITVEGDADFLIEFEGRSVAIVFPSVRHLVSFIRFHVLAGGRLHTTQLHPLLKKFDLILELRVRNVVVGKTLGTMKGDWLSRILGLGPMKIDALALLKLLGKRSR